MDTLTEIETPPTKKEKQKTTSEKIKKLMKSTKVVETTIYGLSRSFKIKNKNKRNNRKHF